MNVYRSIIIDTDTDRKYKSAERIRGYTRIYRRKWNKRYLVIAISVATNKRSVNKNLGAYP